MTNYEKLINTLKEVFMLDKAELDFGIYRIMNQKRKDIEQFLEKELVPQVRQVLESSLSVDKQALQKELDEAIKLAHTLGADPEMLPKVQQIKARMGEAADMVAIENEVFSLLANFFKRYFDNGDFISMRRYKKDVYAIPYEGEEVKLHWANADQYYIKTSEYLKNYRFKLSNGKTVCFELIEASTEQNNNKTQGDKERKFSLADKAVEVIEGELVIPFTYEPADKKIKQADLLAEAFEQVKAQIPAEFAELQSLRPTEKDKQRTLLQKHLLDYTARNTFDYFIHKDLGGFLTRELDFYIKNEVLFIDDLNTRDEQEFLKQLSKIKAIKKIGEKIITFLAQLENFQKKLWLKKKMVVECNYCITLDRVPAELYAEVAANQAQTDEWIRLFAIDEIKGESNNTLFGSDKVGFTTPLTVEFLKQNQFLVLDTAFFSEAFKWKLIGSIEKFDNQCDGLLFNTDNFHGLNLIQEKYRNSIQSLYTDPPYNTSASEILYKNNYKHSSWVSMMDSRIFLSRELLKDTGSACYTIDDFEVGLLKILLDQNFNNENYLATTPIRNNPSGRSTVKGFSINHEYGLYYAKTDLSELGRLPHKEKQKERYNFGDDNGNYEWENLRRNGPDSNRLDRPKQYYPIYYNKTNGIWRIPEMEYDEDSKLWNINDLQSIEEISLFPIHPNGEEKVWRYSVENLINEPDRFKIEIKDESFEVYRKKYLNNDGILPRTWWEDASYSARDNGTRELVDLFGNVKLFDFPKSKYAVKDSLKVLNSNHRDIVLDYFGGSATTGHATIELNREDSGKRKFILMEMGAYFDVITKPRIQKAIYSKDWKDGKPVSRKGISHCFKYMSLESYEDTLNNLEIIQSENQQQLLELNPTFKEGYILNYMLDVETQGSLLNLEWFENPFDCSLRITRNNEMLPTRVDLVETFNYLIGLVVENYAVPKEGYVVVTGKNLAGEKILVVWRNCLLYDNEALNAFLSKSKYNPLDNEFDRIYVNGDNNVENLKVGEERWKVVLIEEEFKNRMFEGN
ncbi:MAG: site-specific DNA-methyltransferase [Paludibacter sp.]